MAIEIVDFPINSMVISNSYVNVYQRVRFVVKPWGAAASFSGWWVNKQQPDLPSLDPIESLRVFEQVLLHTPSGIWLLYGYYMVTIYS